MPDMRWMLFVDGENFTMRGQDVLFDANEPPIAGPYWRRNVYLWIPTKLRRVAALMRGLPSDELVRGYYYTSCQGATDEQDAVRDSLRDLGFDPIVFRRPPETTGRSSKGVDIALTTDVLSHASLDNFGIAVIASGDGDYVPLVEAVKRLGKRVYVLSFAGRTSPALRRASDQYGDFSARLVDEWRRAKKDANRPDVAE